MKTVSSKGTRAGIVNAQFIKEAQITSQLQHPGVAPVYELGSLDTGEMFFTMKEIKGRTLKTLIQKVHSISQQGSWSVTEDGWSLRKLITIFHSVCQTIEYAHSRGVIHCDIKPSNIMVGDYGEVLVVDWGIAKVLSVNGSNDENLYNERDELSSI